MHCVGIDAGFALHATQSGAGTADPMHEIRVNPPGKPVCTYALERSDGSSRLRNSPNPNRTIPPGYVGVRALFHVSPTRGSTAIELGAPSVRCPKVASTAGLYAGRFANAFPSTRAP